MLKSAYIWLAVAAISCLAASYFPFSGQDSPFQLLLALITVVTGVVTIVKAKTVVTIQYLLRRTEFADCTASRKVHLRFGPYGVSTTRSILLKLKTDPPLLLEIPRSVVEKLPKQFTLEIANGGGNYFVTRVTNDPTLYLCSKRKRAQSSLMKRWSEPSDE